MHAWIQPALDYIHDWLEFQMRASQQPGCLVAITHNGKIVAEDAFGHANLASGEKLTPRHRFRIASHTKSFTSAGLMKLREQRRLRLDDPVGDHVSGLHPQVAATTIGQIMSHSAGLVRDGTDAGQFTDRRPFFSREELLADLAKPLTIEPGTRLKYSNHGYGLLGLVIEAATGECYREWITREIIAAAGLRETAPDMPIKKSIPLAQGHTPRLPLDRRLVIPGDTPTHAIAPAAGFVSTAADVARFFGQLAPHAKHSVLTTASRREMTRRHWRNPHATIESHYGLGIQSGRIAGWDCFGHTGGLHGYISRTTVIPSANLSISIFTNATDGPAAFWVDGAIQILRAFATRGGPTKRVRDWTGRYWTSSRAVDLVPIGERVLVATPQAYNPFTDAAEIEVTGKDTGRIAAAEGYSSFGEAAWLERSPSGKKITEVWLGGSRLQPEKAVATEMERKYGRGKRRRAR